MSWDQKKRPGVHQTPGQAQTPRRITSILDQVPDVSRSLEQTPKQKYLAELRAKGDGKQADWFEETGTPDEIYDTKKWKYGDQGLQVLRHYYQNGISAAEVRNAREELVCPACLSPACGWPDSYEAKAIGAVRIRRVMR